MIPPSNVLIVYSLASGGTSVAALFLAGYLPGILTAVAFNVCSCTLCTTSPLPSGRTHQLPSVLQVFRESIPSLMLIFIIIGGIIAGYLRPQKHQQ